MTLVVVFNPEDPIAISDVMLSSTAPAQDRALPNGSTISAEDYTASRFSPISHCQKMMILKGGAVLVLVVGDVDRARMVVHRLKDDIKAGLTLDQLNDFGKRRSSLCGGLTSVIISWIEGGKYAVCCVGPIASKMTVGATTAIYAGSGAEWFSELAVRSGRTLHQQGDFTASEFVRMQAIAQGGFHLLNERTLRTPSTFGGGFQTAYYDGAGFRMSEDITYLMWKIHHDDDGVPFHFDIYPQIVQQRYEQPMLCFDVYALNPDTPGVRERKTVFSGRARPRRTIVEPLLRVAEKRSSDAPPMRTTPIIDNQILHVWDGAIVHVSANQLMGDPELLDLQISQDPSGAYELSVSERIRALFETSTLPTGWQQRAVRVKP